MSIQHFKEVAEAVIADRKPSSQGLVVDIGSNVGTLLSHFQDLGFGNVMGVEPSINISEIAERKGVPTINDFLCDRVTGELKKNGPVEILLSANVVNHADDVDALLRTARAVLAPDGLFVFEVPCLLDLVLGTAFDTIYHEHVHYHAVRPLSMALSRSGFSI